MMMTHWWYSLGLCHNIGCSYNNQVKLYDTLYSGITSFTREQIGALLFSEDSDVIEICVSPVDQQTNGTDCLWSLCNCVCHSILL